MPQPASKLSIAPLSSDQAPAPYPGTALHEAFFCPSLLCYTTLVHLPSSREPGAAIPGPLHIQFPLLRSMFLPSIIAC